MEKEKERNIVWEIHSLGLLHTPQPGTWTATHACALTGNRTSNPLVGGAQSTEPHQPGLKC